MNFSTDTTSCREEGTDAPRSFTLGDFVGVLCNTAHLKLDPALDLEPDIASKLDDPFVDAALKHCHVLYSLQKILRVPFVVKQRLRPKGFVNRYRLLYEGRHLRQPRTNIPYPKKFGAWHLLFARDGALLKLSKSPRSCPKTHVLPPGPPPQTLAQLLDVPDDGRDPQTHEETVAWLEQRNLRHNVKISFCVRHSPTPVAVYWVDWLPPVPPGTQIVSLQAYCERDGRLAFQKQLPANKRGPKKKPIASAAGAAPHPASVTASNRACGAHVQLTGLTKALHLGMLTEDVLRAANDALCKAVATVWLHHDADGQVRQAAYRDGLGCYAVFEIVPGFFTPGQLGAAAAAADKKTTTQGESWTSWKAFFDCVWTRRGALLAHKETILGPLVAAWSAEDREKTTGSYNSCAASLRQSLKKSKIICFCPTDVTVHSLKMPLAHYLATSLPAAPGKRRNRASVTLKTVGNTKIVCLVTPQLDVENAANILGLKLDDRENGYSDEGPELLAVCSEWTGCPAAADGDLPFKPLLEGRPSKSRFAYSPGRVVQERDEWTCVCQRSERLTEATLALYREFCTWVCKTYSLDLTTFSYMSLSSLAFKCVWLSLAEKGGALYQSLEKTKPAYSAVLRRHCRGGFAYSCRGSLASGQPVAEGSSELAVSLTEYDLVSAYGYSVTNMSVPGGFCVGYVLDGASGKLVRADRVDRSKSFEFSATFAVCSRLLDQGEEIAAAWSNYSPLGLCYVGKCPLDLAVVLKSGVTHFINFDGQFAHGCRTCPPLRRYASDKTLQQVLQDTQKRDDKIRAWVRENNATGRLQCAYHVFTDCHDRDFKLSALRDPLLYPRVADLSRPYAALPRDCIPSLDFFLSAPRDLTFLLVGTGRIEKRTAARGPPLLVWKRAAGGDTFYQDFGWETEGDALFTRDSLEYATQLGFKLDRVTHCFFYRTCSVLPRVFDALTRTRRDLSQAGLKAKAKFVKSLVNYSTGMFGYNPQKKAGLVYKSARLVSSVSKKTLANLPARRITWIGQTRHLSYAVVQSRLSSGTANSVALPIYASVVEYGKARLSDCHNFIGWCVGRPGAYRCLYSNTDNLVCALSAPTLAEAVAENRREAFERKKGGYFGNAPGLLTQEWTALPRWEFASPYPCNYSVVQQEGGGRCKTSGFRDLSPAQAHDMNRRVLAQQTTDFRLTQKRRTNKLLDTETRDVDVRPPKLQKLL